MTALEQASLDDLNERLRFVERRSSLLAAIAMLPALALVAVAVMGTSPPKANETRFGTVVARKFVLEDESGVVRGSLNLDNPSSGPELRLQTPDGYQLFMTAGEDHGNFVLMRGGPMSPQSVKQIVQLSATNDEGPSVKVFDSKGYEAIIGAVTLESAKTGRSTTSSAASIHLFGKGGSVLWSAPR